MPVITPKISLKSPRESTLKHYQMAIETTTNKAEKYFLFQKSVHICSPHERLNEIVLQIRLQILRV
jgi:hypothetical protein